MKRKIPAMLENFVTRLLRLFFITWRLLLGKRQLVIIFDPIRRDDRED